MNTATKEWWPSVMGQNVDEVRLNPAIYAHKSSVLPPPLVACYLLALPSGGSTWGTGQYQHTGCTCLAGHRATTLPFTCSQLPSTIEHSRLPYARHWLSGFGMASLTFANGGSVN